jgi:hypothetical protein
MTANERGFEFLPVFQNEIVNDPGPDQGPFSSWSVRGQEPQRSPPARQRTVEFTGLDPNLVKDMSPRRLDYNARPGRWQRTIDMMVESKVPGKAAKGDRIFFGTTEAVHQAARLIPSRRGNHTGTTIAGAIAMPRIAVIGSNGDVTWIASG